MSVPKEQRSKGTLNVNIEARRLAVYTMRITANIKWFPADQKDYTDRLRNAAVDIHTLCWLANNIKADSAAHIMRRTQLQDRAAEKCNELAALIELAKPLFHLTTKRCYFWIMKTNELRGMIRGWRDSDMQRLTP